LVVTGAALASLAIWGFKVSPVAALPVVHAQDENTGCSLATLNGLYSVEGQGTVLAQLPGLPAPPFPFDEVGIDSFNGAGTWYGHVTVNFGGVVLPVTVTGTYTINGDCTGTRIINTSLGLVAHEAIVVTAGGHGFIATQTDAFAVIHRKLERQRD